MMTKLIGSLIAAAALAIALPSPVHSADFAVEIIPPYTADFVPLWCERGEVVKVKLQGDGSTDLDLHVFDLGGRLVRSDRGPSDRAHLRWRCEYTGLYAVAIENLGFLPNLYSIEVR